MLLYSRPFREDLPTFRLRDLKGRFFQKQARGGRGQQSISERKKTSKQPTIWWNIFAFIGTEEEAVFASWVKLKASCLTLPLPGLGCQQRHTDQLKMLLI